MKQVYVFCALIFSVFGYSQVYSYIDFGATESEYRTAGNWNNITTSTSNETGISTTIIDENGNNTGITLNVDDPFDSVNLDGTDNPDSFLPFPDAATTDSFFGETSEFIGNLQPTGGFVLNGLSQDAYYSFVVFASRMGDDNRETLYTLNGASTQSATLQVANNKEDTAEILNIRPDANGQIRFTAEKGPNNDTSNGFYYLGAIQLIQSNTPFTPTTAQALRLNYPNGENVMEAGKTVAIEWQSNGVANVKIEFSANSGASWTSIATVAGDQEYYNFKVPNQITNNALIRISGSGLSDTSDNTFSIIEDDGKVFRIVVLGSSTAAGTGPQEIEDSWVYLYKDYLEEKDTRFEVINLASGGYTTYDILPTGTQIPNNVDRTIDTQRNVTQALALNPGGIVINMPSNDAANGYPVEDQMNNYDLISSKIKEQNIPLWVTSPQPKDFGSNETNKNIQLGMLEATREKFGDMTIDFWTGLGQSNNNGILPRYDSGDGTHMNAAGHRILFDRARRADVGVRVKNDALGLSIETPVVADTFKVYPNPVKTSCTIQWERPVNGNATLVIYDLLGKEVYNKQVKVNAGKINWSKGAINPGIYILKVAYGEKINTQRLLIQ